MAVVVYNQLVVATENHVLPSQEYSFARQIPLNFAKISSRASLYKQYVIDALIFTIGKNLFVCLLIAKSVRLGACFAPCQMRTILWLIDYSPSLVSGSLLLAIHLPTFISSYYLFANPTNQREWVGKPIICYHSLKHIFGIATLAKL